MVRISDIFKKREEPEKGPEPEKEKPTPPPESAFPVSKPAPQKETPEETPLPEMQIARAMKELEPNIAQAKNLYNHALGLAKELFRSAEEKKPIEIKPIKEAIEEIVNHFVLEEKTLLNLFYADYPPEDYIPYHAINVAVLSIGLATGIKSNKSRINELALAAFLHDVGMVKVKEIAAKSHKLSKEEYEKIKEHPMHSIEILSEIKDISQEVIYAIRDTHECYNGKGYPEGRKDGEISEYGRIIGIADVYEALTHHRTYRKKYPPYDAIKEILASMAPHFDPALVRALVSQVGIYPIGSWIELNTNEIGRVIATDEEFPLRPVLNIIFDSAKRRLPEPKVINLAKQYNLYIKRSLSDSEVSRETQK